MSSSDLKIVGIITMLIDHIGAIYFPSVFIFRLIGRIAFPIFAFLIVEGYVHTKDFKKYILRLLAFAIISEVPFDLAFDNTWFYIGSQNVLFTFVIALLVIHTFEFEQNNILKVLEIVVLVAFSIIFNTDYSVFGIAMVVVFYVHRDKKLLKCLLVVGINLLLGSLIVNAGGFSLMNFVQAFAILAIPFIWFYNGKKGKNLKYLFYAFYPVHLLVLGIGKSLL